MRLEVLNGFNAAIGGYGAEQVLVRGCRRTNLDDIACKHPDAQNRERNHGKDDASECDGIEASCLCRRHQLESPVYKTRYIGKASRRNYFREGIRTLTAQSSLSSLAWPKINQLDFQSGIVRIGFCPQAIRQVNVPAGCQIHLTASRDPIQVSSTPA